MKRFLIAIPILTALLISEAALSDNTQLFKEFIIKPCAAVEGTKTIVELGELGPELFPDDDELVKGGPSLTELAYHQLLSNYTENGLINDVNNMPREDFIKNLVIFLNACIGEN